MTSVKFSSFTVSDKSEPLSLETLYRHWAAFSGVLKTAANSLLSGYDSSHWTAGLTNVGYGFFVLQRTGTTVSNQRSLYDTDLPMSYVMEFQAGENAWNVRIRSDSTGDNCLIIKMINASPKVLYIMQVVSNTETMIIGREIHNDRGLNVPTQVRIGIKDEQNSMVSSYRNIGVSVWFNDELMLSAGLISATALGQRLGFDIVPGGAATLFDRLSISALGETLAWSSLDPGEAPMAAIQRAVEDRYIKQWSRWDGSLYVYSPVARSSSLQISRDREYGLRKILDRRQLFSHLRVIGAAQWVQLIDTSLISVIGHRFKETNNPSLWSTSDCQRMGLSLFVRAKEQADRAELTTTGLPFLEPEDRIQIPDMSSPTGYLDYIVDSLRWSTAADNSMVLTLSLRSYHY